MNIETEISPELWTAVRRSYESQAWSNAILDGIYYLSDVIRSRTGLQSDGTALAGQALGGKSPKLRLTKLQSESDISLQTGAEALLRGLYQAVRNPRSHDRVDDSQKTADSLLVFVDYLLGLIGHAKTAFSLDEAVSRVLEEHFVPSERYASLLAEEIPPRQRLNVALAAFEREGNADQKRLAFFYQAVLEKLPPEERGEFFGALSESLRGSSDDDTLRAVMQILRPEQWIELTEVSRLRSESRLLRDFRNGRYDKKTKRCIGGALATWAIGFWPYFTLKAEFLDAAADLISSPSDHTYDYLWEFGFTSLPSLADAPTYRIQKALIGKIKNRDSDVYISVKYEIIWDKAVWDKWMVKALAEYEAAEQAEEQAQAKPIPPADSSEDDDIPF